MDRTLALIGRAHQGDKEARDTVFEENKGLIYSVVKRFLGRGAEPEDLFQLGSIGLLKAVDRFDSSFEVKFSTYAVPMIAGEIRRFLRDDGMLKVSRSLKEGCARVCRMREELEKSLGREPDMGELSEALHMPPEELAMTLEAGLEVESLSRPLSQSDGAELTLADRLPERKDDHQRLIDRMFLEEMLRTLDKEERQLICLRYFQDQTQAAAGKLLGISQVQVSRMEKRILENLRKKIT